MSTQESELGRAIRTDLARTAARLCKHFEESGAMLDCWFMREACSFIIVNLNTHAMEEIPPLAAVARYGVKIEWRKVRSLVRVEDLERMMHFYPPAGVKSWADLARETAPHRSVADELHYVAA